MNILQKNLDYAHILIVGSGVIGKFIGSELIKNGFKVTIADPNEENNGSNASLGLLMGRIYKKRTGRAWILRKRSLVLWPRWIEFLKKFDPEIKIDKPLIQLTTNQTHYEIIKKFVENNPFEGLEILQKESTLLRQIKEFFPNTNLQGIVSHEDGRIDPKILLRTLDIYLKNMQTKFIKNKIIDIEKTNNIWTAICGDGERIDSHIIVLCNSLNSKQLINKMKIKTKLKPVLGQAIELTFNKNVNFSVLPKIFSINGKNFIPVSNNKIIIGSTSEEDHIPEKKYINELTECLNPKPLWMEEKYITKKWHGIRSQPIGEGSPIMKGLEKGLILCTGFYKNGILLAPACSEWLMKEIISHF